MLVEGTPTDPADVPNQRTAAERAAAERAASLRAVFASSPRPGQAPDGSPRVPGEITGSWRLVGTAGPDSDARGDAGQQPGGGGHFGGSPVEPPKRRKRRLWLVPFVIVLLAAGGGAAYVAMRGNPFPVDHRVATVDPSAGETPDPQPTDTGLAGDPAPSSAPSLSASAPIESAPTAGASASLSLPASLPPSAPAGPPPGRPNPGKVNLALHKKAESLSDEQPGFPAAAAVDGDLTTRWSSGFSDPQWIRVDLADVWSITDIKLDWQNAYAKSYHVDVSLDAKHWTTVYRTAKGGAGVRDIPIRPTAARYVRMYGTQRSTQYGYSLLEFEVR
jgi:hypothetical protein